ncbi:MAG TPA: guanylate kinase [Longimicrobium sp.]
MSAPDLAFPLVLSAPSGAGKTTLANRLRERNPKVVFSVSATTRQPRPYEQDGKHYHFVPRDEFVRMRNAGELIEWAEVHGEFYGTPLANVRAAGERGEHLLLDIDVQGAAQIRAKVPEAVLVFILPPSGTVLVERLKARRTESAEALSRRLRNAEEEIRRAGEFHHVVVNDELDRAVEDLEMILRGEGGGIRRIPSLEREIERICAEIDAYLDQQDAVGAQQ